MQFMHHKFLQPNHSSYRYLVSAGWFTLISLTVALCVYPLTWQLQYGSVQPLEVIEKPIVFILLFLTWITILFALLFFSKNDPKRILLLLILSAIFLSFWVIRVPNGTVHDEYMNMGITNYILGNGPLSQREASTLYLNYPILHMFGAETSIILNASILDVRFFITPLFTLIFTLELYVFFKGVLGAGGEVISTVLAILSNLLWQSFQAFSPIEIGYLLFMMLLIALAKKRYIVCYIVWPILVMAYLPASILFLLVVGGLIFVEKLLTNKISSLIRHLPYLIGFFFAWNLYWSISTFHSVLGYLSYFLTNGLDMSWTANTINVVSNVPIWVTVTQYFWVIFLPLLGLSVGLFKIFSKKTLNYGFFIVFGGVIATLFFGIASFILVPGGIQWARFFYYGPIFFAPLIAGFIFNQRKKMILPALLAILVVASLPTFFVQSRDISVKVVYNYERELGCFLNNNLNLETQQVNVDPATVSILQYYIPQARFVTVTSYNFKDLTAILTSNSTGALDVVTSKSNAILSFYYGANATGEYINGVTCSTATNSRVYDSQWTQMYVR
jgi:hypothetical protein